MPRKVKKAKLPAGLSEEFVQEATTLSVDEMKTRIVTMQGQIVEARAFLKADETALPLDQVEGARRLVDLKMAYDEAAGPTRDTIAALKARTKYLVEELKKSGAL